jgi:hypothetical protein
MDNNKFGDFVVYRPFLGRRLVSNIQARIIIIQIIQGEKSFRTRKNVNIINHYYKEEAEKKAERERGK